MKRTVIDVTPAKAGVQKTAARRLPTFVGMTALAWCFVSAAQAVTISNISFSNTNITYEQGGIPNGTTVSFTIDSPGRVDIDVFPISGSGTAGDTVSTLTETYATPGAKTLFWNAMWFIDGFDARIGGDYKFSLFLSTSGASDTETPSTVIKLDSVDIRSLGAEYSLDSEGQPTFPVTLGWILAKPAYTYVRVYNSSGTLVRTLLNGTLRPQDEPQLAVWNGLTDDGSPVATGVYTVKYDATDPGISDSTAIQRSLTITVASLAGAGDVQALFENNNYVYPNPIRDGLGTFRVQAARGGAHVTLKIYTLNGDLVKEHDFGAVSVGVVHEYQWHTTNDAGNKVGRGLYYYVVREEDGTGTLQITKKLAVIK